MLLTAAIQAVTLGLWSRALDKVSQVSQMSRTAVRQTNSQTFTLLLLVVVVSALYLAKEVLIPLAMAGLLTFILAPVVDRLERWHLGRVPSIAVVVIIAFAVLGGIGLAIAQQVIDLADELPRYEQNLVEKAHDLTSRFSRGGPLARIEETVGELNREIAGKRPPAADASNDPPVANSDGALSGPTPVPVEIVQQPSSSFEYVSEFLSGAFGWFATLGVILLFTVFMLASREDLRNRLIRLVGPDQITVTTQALDEAGGRVSRYLRMQLIINASFGMMLAIGLYVVGLPNALLWGVLAGLLRYVPYLGAWIAAALVAALSLAVFDTWTQPLATIGLFAVAELITGNVLEPVLFHSSTGVSTIGVLVAAVFWTWLWGPLGLVLSMPLTVCIVVMGRYVPQLEFMSVMFGDDAALSPAARYYQRLLVGDLDGARDLVQAVLKEHTLDELFDAVLLPALLIAEQDAQRDVLDSYKHEFILENIREQVEELGESVVAEAVVAGPVMGDKSRRRGVVCVPARDAADEIAAMMLQARLAARGVNMELLAAKLLGGEAVEQVASLESDLIVISAAPPFGVRQARYLCKRLKSQAELRVLVGVWGEQRHMQQVEERLRAAGAEKVVHTLSAAAEFVERLKPAASPPVEAQEVVTAAATHEAR